MCNAPYPGSHLGAVSRADVMSARTAAAQHQMVPDRGATAVGAEAGTRGGKMKMEKSSSAGVDHLAQRVGPYPTPQQYMLNKRAKYAATAAPEVCGQCGA